ncbi:MAG: flagellar hook-basal body protein [Vicinamibacterales bacterium]
MAGGAYIALSGLRARVDQLDRLASDLANAGTSGYKAERTTTVAAERPTFRAALESAVDVASGPGRIDFRPGTIEPTGRDLDFALEGDAFFVVDTPQGARYTRNGQFSRRADGTLTTSDDMPIAGEDGTIKLSQGAVTVDADGTVRAGGVAAGKLRLARFQDLNVLTREDNGRFRAPAEAALAPTAVTVKAGSLEQSNVSVADRMVQLTELSRGFEALQRGITILMNDVDGKAISELGRR